MSWGFQKNFIVRSMNSQGHDGKQLPYSQLHPSRIGLGCRQACRTFRTCCDLAFIHTDGSARVPRTTISEADIVYNRFAQQMTCEL